jgi:hypothetical protein
MGHIHEWIVFQTTSLDTFQSRSMEYNKTSPSPEILPFYKRPLVY